MEMVRPLTRVARSGLVVFVAAASCCVSVAPAAEYEQLTTDGLFKRDPVFVGNGEAVVYSVQHDSIRMVLCRLRLSDGQVERLHPQANLPEFKPSFASDGKSYLFVQSRGNDNLTLVYRRVAESKEQVIGSPVWSPVLHPNGSRVVYSLSHNGGKQLLSMKTDGSDRRFLTATPGYNMDAAWSPDGKRIAFVSSRGGDLDIYVMQADDSHARQLTRSAGRDVHPAWSPDGRRLAFTSVRDGNRELYVVNDDGSHVVRVTNRPEIDDYPAWHPDGRQLLFVGERDGRIDLFLVRVDGGGRRSTEQK